MTSTEIKNSTLYTTEDELLQLGKTAVSNLEQYGATTWYDWRTRGDTWNTKWNSYSASYDGGNEVYFQTAWYAPHPIVQKLSASFYHNGESEWLFVFEGPIDMLAFITLHQKEWMKHSYVALCSVSERAILHRLKVNKNIKKVVLCLDHDNAGIAACVRIKDILLQNGYTDVRMLHSVNKDWDEDVKALNGISPIKAESDETEAIRKLCREFISGAKELRKPPQLLGRISDVFTSIQNMMPHINKEQIEKLIGLLLLLSKDECRKSLSEVSWDKIYDRLISEYIPYADNGNTEIRIRQLSTDMSELMKVYELPNMLNDIDIFTKPILKVAMDCIRLINHLERKK